MPSPPQRRLSRSSIDLRDLEQHDRLIHTDSAPSMVELKHFYSKQSAENTPEKSIQPFVPKTNLLDCLNLKSSNRKKNNALDAVMTESDDNSLARFIEDNYRHFKKQNDFANLSTTSIISNNSTFQLQSLARSDPEFLLFKNSSDCGDTTNSNYIICRKKMKNIKKNKMSAMSDSDFLVSLNDKSRKLTFKSKIPFKTIFNGKFPRNSNNKYNMLDHPPTTKMTILNIASTITPPPTIIYPTVLLAESMTSATLIQPPELTYMQSDSHPMNIRRCSLNTNLSKSLNGFYCNNKHGNKSLKPIQRFSSEDNSTTAMNNEKRKQDEAQPPCDAIDLFLRLYQREENNKNLRDDLSIDKFNYKFVLNSSINGVSEIESISSKFSPHAIVNQARVPQQNYLDAKESSERQSLQINEDNLNNLKCQVSVLSHDVTKLDGSTLNNSNVVTDQIVKNVNGANISDEIKGSKCNDIFTKKVNSMKRLSAEVNTVVCDVPLEVNVNSVSRRSKTDEIISFESMYKYKKDESLEINRARKQSVTYDINVIHRSQDLRIDEICPQPKSTFAMRSGSMASTSKY